MIRNYGVHGLQKHIREGVRLAKKFEALVLADHRFEIPATRHLGEWVILISLIIAYENVYSFLAGMVVFRLKGENELTEKVIERFSIKANLFQINTISCTAFKEIEPSRKSPCCSRISKRQIRNSIHCYFDSNDQRWHNQGLERDSSCGQRDFRRMQCEDR